MLELWKPYMWLEDKNKTLIFNELEQFYIPRYKSVRPFVIFYDKYEDCYYYLKARTANLKFPEKKLPEEVLIPRNVDIDHISTYKGLFVNDSWIDCSQIFKCDRELLESLVDVDNTIHQNTPILERKYISKILDKMKECVFKIPPNLSILYVKYDSKINETYAESLYLSPKKLEQAIEKLNDDIYPWETIRDIDDFISTKDAEFSYQRERYKNGIKFCETFLNEYFPNELGKFYLSQGLAKVDEELLNKDNNNSKNKKTEKDFSM